MTTNRIAFEARGAAELSSPVRDVLPALDISLETRTALGIGGSIDRPEVENGPRRQYRIYSSDVLHPLSSPLHDTNDDLDDDSLPLLSPSPSPNQSSSNDSNSDYLNPNPETVPPTESGFSNICPAPIPSALSSGESYRGEGEGEIAVIDRSGALSSKPGLYNCTAQLTQHANHIKPETRVDDLCNGVAASGSLSSTWPAGTGLSENAISTVNDDCGNCIDGVTVSFNSEQTSSSGSGISRNQNITVTNAPASSCIDSNPTATVLEVPELPLYQARDESSLNRADLAEIHRHEHILDRQQVKLLKMIEDKVDLHPQRYNRDNYRQNASFLILSKSPSAERLAFCGIPNYKNRSGTCSRHPFCPFCCWHVRNAAQLAFVPSYYAGTWHFLTGSFTGELRFTGNDGFDWLHYWDAYKHGLSALVKEGLIDGAYWTEELAVISFLPTMVLPHVHAIVDAPELTETTIELLKEEVSGYLKNHLGTDSLAPNVKASPIKDQKALFDRIGYMFKPMKLLKAYEKAWAGASFHNRARVWELNSQLTDLIRGHSEITRCRPKMKGKGTLNPKEKLFIGVRKKKNRRPPREHEALINEMKRLPTEFIQDVTDEEEVLNGPPII